MRPYRSVVAANGTSHCLGPVTWKIFKRQKTTDDHLLHAPIDLAAGDVARQPRLIGRPTENSNGKLLCRNHKRHTPAWSRRVCSVVTATKKTPPDGAKSETGRDTTMELRGLRCLPTPRACPSMERSG